MIINATLRLKAAQASEVEAMTFLKSLGFKNLKVKMYRDNVLQFNYKSLDKANIIEHLGESKPTGLNDVYWKIGTSGFLILKELVNVVALKNINRDAGLTVKPVETHVPLVKQESPDNPGSHYNDDDGVPHVGIPLTLTRTYQYCQFEDKKHFRIDYMYKLWEYFNHKKFNGLMEKPNISLLRHSDPNAFKVRGSWTAFSRKFQISPRLFNASIEFFVEVFLHEMCHQAVSEIDKVRDNTEGGHGPNWQTWMRRVGLNPNRFDTNDNSTYMTREEKQRYGKK